MVPLKEVAVGFFFMLISGSYFNCLQIFKGFFLMVLSFPNNVKCLIFLSHVKGAFSKCISFCFPIVSEFFPC